MNCEQLDAALLEYLSGRLPERQAVALEAHAAECMRCEARLDAATRLPALPPDPPPPAALRAATLASVRRAGRRATVRRWATGAAAAAAVAIIAMSIGPAEKRASDVPGGASILLAADRARPEFAALDAAARELESALRADPSDPELHQYLDAVNERRAALSRRVREAAL